MKDFVGSILVISVIYCAFTLARLQLRLWLRRLFSRRTGARAQFTPAEDRLFGWVSWIGLLSFVAMIALALHDSSVSFNQPSLTAPVKSEERTEAQQPPKPDKSPASSSPGGEVAVNLDTGTVRQVPRGESTGRNPEKETSTQFEGESSDDYGIDSPEHAVLSFYEAWMAENFDGMAVWSNPSWNLRHEKPARELRETFGHMKPLRVKIVRSNVNSNDMAARVEAVVEYRIDSLIWVARVRPMVIREDHTGYPRPWSRWTINPSSIATGDMEPKL